MVARVRRQWLAPPTNILLSTVNEYLEKNPSARYQTGSIEHESCISANTPRAKPKYKRARSTLEPSATEEALAHSAKAVVTGRVIAFEQAVPNTVDLPEVFSQKDRDDILKGVPRWAAKHPARQPPIPDSMKAELTRLHSLAGHHVSAAKIHTDLMRTAGWVARCCVDVARIKQFFSSLANTKKNQVTGSAPAPNDGDDVTEEGEDVDDMAGAGRAMDEAMDEAEEETELIEEAEE